MDPRLENLKQMMGIKEIPIGTHVTFKGENFPDFYPDYVKSALSKVRVPLYQGGPELPESDSRELKEKYGVDYTYRVGKDDLLSALEKVDPRASVWYRSRFFSNLMAQSVVFMNDTVEGIVD